MTSPSEPVAQAPSQPSLLTPLPDARHNPVARLVFQSVEELETAEHRPASAANSVPALDEAAALEAQLRVQADAFTLQLAEARSEAHAVARLEYEQQLDERLQQERTTLLRVTDRFAQERTRYFAAVEEQVVRLALAIAARVLHREAKMDPILLMGAARVALEKIQDDSETILRVSSEDLSMWMSQFADGTSARSFRIVPDDRIERGDCTLETSVGTVELGVEIQLAEIERGFFDLLQKRPA